MNKAFVVGITGGSGSGKSYFLSSLMKNFSPEEITLVSQDNYYRPRSQQPVDSRGVSNFDTPESIDADQFAHDLCELIAGRQVEKEEYTFNNPSLAPSILIFNPAPVIIAEGLFIFYDSGIAGLFDLKIFLDASEDIKIRRRIFRDQEARGYAPEDVLYRYENHVTPAYKKFIEPLKHGADIIIPNNHDFKRGLEMLTVYLKAILHKI